MQEGRNWTYQVDTYGLCNIVHMMLDGAPMTMSVQKVPRAGGYEYLPKAPFKRYWNVELWMKLFSTLLNAPSNGSDVEMLRDLRTFFREHMCGNQQLVRRLKQMLETHKAASLRRQPP